MPGENKTCFWAGSGTAGRDIDGLAGTVKTVFRLAVPVS
jgi:hypothetical protein